jgi:beta-xylosidase
MRRRALVLAVLSALLLGLAACDLPNRAVLTSDAPDPDIAWDGQQYVLHTTNSTYGNVPTWTSTDLANWTYRGDALPTLPAWADSGWTWAPTSIRRADGKWFLYFSAAVRGQRTPAGEPVK